MCSDGGADHDRAQNTALTIACLGSATPSLNRTEAPPFKAGRLTRARHDALAISGSSGFGVEQPLISGRNGLETALQHVYLTIVLPLLAGSL